MTLLLEVLQRFRANLYSWRLSTNRIKISIFVIGQMTNCVLAALFYMNL